MNNTLLWIKSLENQLKTTKEEKTWKGQKSSTNIYIFVIGIYSIPLIHNNKY